MKSRPPVQSLRQNLPFQDPAFGWDTFEDFFCDFLNAQPEIVVNEAGTEIRQRVIRAQPFGRKGDSQYGIDLRAEMEGGEVWEFQCKHYKEWGPTNAQKAIDAYTRSAPRKFLLVTRDVSEKCKAVVAKHPGWCLWDAREINRRFRELGGFKGAPILFTHFGPGWDEAFFGISGDGPLIGAEAKFAPLLTAGHRFHHRHTLIGRQAFVDGLDKFVRDETFRVVILTGRGGVGKSRLLLQWSRIFKKRHKNYTLRFVSEKCEDFGPALRNAPRPLVLVFDDAHRYDDVRRALFHEIPRRDGIKLVLALRPGPITQVMQELFNAGFDTTGITTADAIEPLTSAETMELVDAGLKPEFSQYRAFLFEAAKDCPLIAVMGAELINARVLTSGDLLDAAEFQQRVFNSLIEVAEPVRSEFGGSPTDGFLRLLALLGPVKLDTAFFAKTAPFLEIQHADRVSHLRDALDRVGLLHTTGAGTRVTPDLLSDHIAYAACYDHVGQSRTFAERVLNHFSPEEFPKMIQHLAEAEWRALGSKHSADSVVEPLWKWFINRFKEGDFIDRGNQIQQWTSIAYIQPGRSLELAELALSLKVAPTPQQEWLQDHSWDSHEHSIESIPRMLANVAQYHSTILSRCFDLLWQIGHDKPSSFVSHQAHPIALIGEVVTYKVWKPLIIFDAALDWFEHFLGGDRWKNGCHELGWLLTQFFEPMLATCIEERWRTGRTLHLRPHPINLDVTGSLRDRILVLIRRLLDRRDDHIANQLVQVLAQGCDIARFFHGDPPATLVSRWNIERLKFLAVFEEMIPNFSEPLIHFHIRRSLMHFLQYGNDDPVVRAAIRKVISAIPDTLEFLISMAVFGNDYEEFEDVAHKPGSQAEIKTRWETFNRQVASKVRIAMPDVAEWLAYFSQLDSTWRSFDGFIPDFRYLLCVLSEVYPLDGLAVVQIMLEIPEHPFLYAFDGIVISATKFDFRSRLGHIQAAASGEKDSLKAAAVDCCRWWRRDGAIPEEAWECLESLAPTASPIVADKIVDFVSFNAAKGTLRDWHLLVGLPFESNDSALAGRIAGRVVDLIAMKGLAPNAESVGQFLRRFEVLTDLDECRADRAFVELAEAFPVQLFLMLWSRYQARKSGNISIKSFPYCFSRIRFSRIMESPEVKVIIKELEERLAADSELDFDEIMLLQSAVQGSENPAGWLVAAAGRATTAGQLNTLREVGSVGEYCNAALAYPDFARALLIKARYIGGDSHSIQFQRLLHVGGGRGSESGKPDRSTQALIAKLEYLAAYHGSDAELGPVFSAILKRERSDIAFHEALMLDDD